MLRSKSITLLLTLGAAGILSGQTSNTRIITTAAGGDWVFPTSPTPPLNAPLGRIAGVAISAKGDIFLADRDNCLVVKIDHNNGLLAPYAGSGQIGFFGDGGPAISAKFNCPAALALDSSGNLYIADPNNNRIRKVNAADGTITTVAGTGTAGFVGDGSPVLATNTPLNNPEGVAVDVSYFYIADTSNFRIRRVSLATKMIETFAGGGLLGSGDQSDAKDASLDGPIAVTVDNLGKNLLIVDGKRVRAVPLTGGGIKTVAGNGIDVLNPGDGGPAVNAALLQPSGLVLDSAGDIFIAEDQGLRIRKIDTKGVITTYATNTNNGLSAGIIPGQILFPAGIAMDAFGTIFIGDPVELALLNVQANGVKTNWAGNTNYHVTGDGIAVAMVLTQPRASIADAAGNVYVADTGADVIRKITGNTITTLAGNGKPGSGDATAPGQGRLAQFNSPAALALDANGNLYVADAGNNTIRVVHPDRSVITLVPNSSFLSNPSGVAVDAAGNVYVSNTGSSRVTKFLPTGVSAGTFAGSGQQLHGYDGDGGLATAALLLNPTGLAYDNKNGILYIADTGNHCIRKVDSSGKIFTAAGTCGQGGVGGDGGSATAAHLFTPYSVAVDAAGNLYIADTGNGMIRMVDLTGKIIRIAGNGQTSSATGIGDGGDATLANLFTPYGVGVDGLGQVYIADTNNNRIRVVLPPIDQTYTGYTASQNAITFNLVSGGPAPDPKFIDLIPVIPGLSFKIDTDSNLITADPTEGAMAGTVQVSLNPSGFTAPGTKTQHLIITTPTLANKTKSIPVTVTVAPPAPQPVLSVDTNSIQLVGVKGGATAAGRFKVLNVGSGAINYTTKVSTADGANWLSVSSASGSATLAQPDTVQVLGSIAALSPGTYSGAITVSAPGVQGSPQTVGVTLSVSINTASILLSQTGLSFTAVEGNGPPLPQTIGILNVGQGVMTWNATVSTTTGQNWLKISSHSATVERPFLDISPMDISIDPTGLHAGTYYGKLVVSAQAINTPSLITVILTVLPAGFNPGPEIRPSGVIFICSPGFTPPPQDVSIGTTLPQDSFTSQAFGASFLYQPAVSGVSSNLPTRMRIFPNCGVVAPGTSDGHNIGLEFSSNQSLQSVHVLIVSAPTSSTNTPRGQTAALASGNPSDASACGNNLLTVFKAPAQVSTGSFQATVGQPVSIEVQVSDACGAPLGADSSSGTAAVVATLSNGDANVPLHHIGGGVWTGTWRPVHKQSNLKMNVDASSGNGKQLGSPILSGTLITDSSTPVMTAGGVVPAAAGFLAGAPIAPGSLITIYGSNFNDPGAKDGTATGSPLPLTLCNTTVMLGQTPLPILYCSATQLNVQVPFNVPVNTPFQLTVQHGTMLAMPESLPVTDAQPAIFTDNQQGTGQGDVFYNDSKNNSYEANSDTPAPIGATVVIYCSGLGAVLPAVQEGHAAPADPLAVTVSPVTVTIGGKAATVLYAGLTPRFAGLYQVNATIAAGTPTGKQPIVLSVSGHFSPAQVSMWVK